jgi:hypothetical protein
MRATNRESGHEAVEKSYLKYIRPLFPTFATVNCLPSRPAEPPSGAMSNFSPSASTFLTRHAATFSSCDFRSVTGTRGFAATGGMRILLVHLPVTVSFPVNLGLVLLNLASRSPPLGDNGLRCESSRCGCRTLRPAGRGDEDGRGLSTSKAMAAVRVLGECRAGAAHCDH